MPQQTERGRARSIHEPNGLYIVKFYPHGNLVPSVHVKDLKAEAMQLIREQLLY